MPKCELPTRAVMALLAFTGLTIVYMLRVNLSVALVAMVNDTTVDLNGTEQVCPTDRLMNQTSSPDSAEFNWDAETQGLVLGSFFWGYILTQIPGGVASEIYGSKWIFGLGVLWPSLLTLLTPMAARTGVAALVCLRVLEGVGEGVTYPSVHAMLGRWIPPMERTMVTVFVFCGGNFGTVIGLPISGLLCSGEFLGGWPAAFYTFGAVGCLWFVLWASLAHSSPASHPSIGQQERQLIEASLANQPERESIRSIPIRRILTSMPVWSLVANHVSYNWTSYMLLTCLPTFLTRILAIPIKENGFASALPYAAVVVVSNAAAIAADALRCRRLLSTTRARKLCTAVGAVCIIVGMTTIGQLGCNYWLAVAWLTASVGLYGISLAGYGPNHLDLAPRYAGTLLGLTNSLATVPGMVAPVVVGAVTNDAETRANWQKVFYLSAGINAAGALLFLAFGSGELQPWAQQPVKEAEAEAEEEAEKERAPAESERQLLINSDVEAKSADYV